MQLCSASLLHLRLHRLHNTAAPIVLYLTAAPGVQIDTVPAVSVRQHNR